MEKIRTKYYHDFVTNGCRIQERFPGGKIRTYGKLKPCCIFVVKKISYIVYIQGKMDNPLLG